MNSNIEVRNSHVGRQTLYCFELLRSLNEYLYIGL
jgi:hypothetical protein